MKGNECIHVTTFFIGFYFHFFTKKKKSKKKSVKINIDIERYEVFYIEGLIFVLEKTCLISSRM